MSVFGVLFWLWLSVSVVVLVARRLRRRGDRSAPAARDARPVPPREPRSGSGPTDNGEPPARTEPAEIDGSTRTTTSAPTPTTGADRAPIPTRPEAPASGAAPSTPGGSSASTGGTATPAPDSSPPFDPEAEHPPPGPADGAEGPVGGSRDGRPAGLAEVLAGIRMPCDLAPLTLGASDLDPTCVDLATTGVGSTVVMEELDRELTRLGFEVADVGDGEHLAHRDGIVVRARVHDRPALSVRADGRGFPTAPPDGIVVELSLT